MKLLAAKIALAPVLIAQGRRVRREALRLPEAAGPRSGAFGAGPPLTRLLLLGDSATAGVGAEHQRDALACRLAEELARTMGRIEWQLVARSGVDTAEAVSMLDAVWAERGDALRADVVVVGLGVNDVTGQVPVARWLRRLDALVERLQGRHGARLVVLNGLPPMHRFPALPQPLRWYLGACARGHDRALRQWAAARPGLLVHGFPPIGDVAAMATDGFHPGPLAYRAWAGSLAQAIVSAEVR